MKRQLAIIGGALVAACAKAPDLAGPMPLAVCTPPTPTPSAGPSAPGTGARIVVLRGTVYGPDGAPAEGAVVRVTSLDAAVPYTASASTSEGKWVVNNLPDGVLVQVVAGKDNWVTQRHLATFLSPSTVHLLDLYAETPLPPL